MLKIEIFQKKDNTYHYSIESNNDIKLSEINKHLCFLKEIMNIKILEVAKQDLQTKDVVELNDYIKFIKENELV